MYRILVVDDEPKIRELIKKYIEFEGHEAILAENGMDAITICSKEDIDIIILDIMMPLLDGFSTLRKIRETSNVPVIMVSAKGEEYDKIHGFDLGVDDYVVKPFSPKELMMRVEAIMKRIGATEVEEEEDMFIYKELIVDFKARKVTIDKKTVQMTPKEIELLFYMIRNKNIALSREQILESVWGYDFYGDDRTLDTHIKLIRKNLKEYSKLIVTLRGVGYRFEDDE